MERKDLLLVRGLLADMDGVWYVGEHPVAGAAAALARLRARGVPVRIITNTTTRTRAELGAKMRALGLAFEDHEIVNTPAAAVAHLRKRAFSRVRLVVSDAIRSEFASFEDAPPPQAIVIGDIGDAWNHRLMTDLFRLVMEGAEMVALHKGRYWQAGDGLALDIGAYVAGLEYVTGRAATVIGKPSRALFQAALDDMKLKAEDVAMIGDDVFHDVGGAQAAGIRGVLVKTGKFREDAVARSGITPDLVIDSIADL